jgi:hypothetical protein
MFLLLILIVKRPVNIVWDWIILAGACISALAAFGQMDELGRELGELSGFFGGFGTASGNSNRLQPGAYVILIGLIISLLSLIMASTRKENKLLLDPFNKINHY